MKKISYAGGRKETIDRLGHHTCLPTKDGGKRGQLESSLNEVGAKSLLIESQLFTERGFLSLTPRGGGKIGGGKRNQTFSKAIEGGGRFGKRHHTNSNAIGL